MASRVVDAVAPVSYVSMVRWAELQQYAATVGVAWPLAATLRDEFGWFAAAFNASGATNRDENGHDLGWLHAQLFNKTAGGLVEPPARCHERRRQWATHAMRNCDLEQ